MQERRKKEEASLECIKSDFRIWNIASGLRLELESYFAYERVQS